MGHKLPSFQFYPGDWLKDLDLRRCSHGAKGVWMDMLCLMFQSEERGVLITRGVPWTDEEIVEAVGGDTGTTAGHLLALLEKGVARRRPDGAVFCERMVREESERQRWRLSKQKTRSAGSCPAIVPPLSRDCPTLSSSSSSSSSSIKKETTRGEVAVVSIHEIAHLTRLAEALEALGISRSAMGGRAFQDLDRMCGQEGFGEEAVLEGIEAFKRTGQKPYLATIASFVRSMTWKKIDRLSKQAARSGPATFELTDEEKRLFAEQEAIDAAEKSRREARKVF